MTMLPRAFVPLRGLFLPLAALFLLAAGPAGAQSAAGPRTGVLTPPAQETPSRALTLDQVIDLAESRSEQIAIAQFGVARAAAGEQRARSEMLPQLSGAASYDRTLKSEFSGLFSDGAGGADDGGFGGDFSELPFGQANAFRLNLAFSQAVYAGGRFLGLVSREGVGEALSILLCGVRKQSAQESLGQA